MPKKAIKTKEGAEKDRARYVEGIGRRKTAVARVRIYPSTSKPLKEVTQKEENKKTVLLDAQKFDVVINEKTIDAYFGVERLKQTALAPFNALNVVFKTTVKIEGGGQTAQAEAIRLGLSRALETLNEKWRPRLKAMGFLSRDARMVERKHPGLRKARRPQQWRKR